MSVRGGGRPHMNQCEYYDSLHGCWSCVAFRKFVRAILYHLVRNFPVLVDVVMDSCSKFENCKKVQKTEGASKFVCLQCLNLHAMARENCAC